MVRTIPADRFPAVVAAATRVFITHGYQRTQVQDVADALGLAKGTLYGYADGKAALFAAAVRYADGHEAWPVVADLPGRQPRIDGPPNVDAQHSRRIGDRVRVRAARGRRAAAAELRSRAGCESRVPSVARADDSRGSGQLVFDRGAADHLSR